MNRITARCLTTLAVVALLAACQTDKGGIDPTGNPNYKSKILTYTTPMTRGTAYSITVCTTNASALDNALVQTSTYIYLNTNQSIVGAVTLANHNVSPLVKKGYTNWTGNITIPAGHPTGQNYLISIADKLNQQAETSENDNTNIVAVTIN